MKATADNHDDNYMSDVFLQTVEPTTTQKKCFSNKQQLVNKNPLSKKKIDEMMTDTLLTSMNTAVDKKSKGFKLLEKFGYQKEEDKITGLGKNSTGISEPICILPRATKEGLGRSTFVEKTFPKKRKIVECNTDEFLSGEKSRSADRHGCSLCSTARKTISELDSRGGRRVHSLWPKYQLEKLDDLSELGHGSMSNRVVTVVGDNNNIREGDGICAGDGDGDEQYDPFLHSVCADEMVVSKPSDKMTDDVIGKASPTLYDTRKNGISIEILEDSCSLLAECLEYLRSAHWYCLYCGVQYDSAEDMNSNCPGLAEEDHD